MYVEICNTCIFVLLFPFIGVKDFYLAVSLITCWTYVTMLCVFPIFTVIETCYTFSGKNHFVLHCGCALIFKYLHYFTSAISIRKPSTQA